ncbi:MAG: carbamoyltransferase HypF [Deltaproteobacteria bacterium]|nr:MAG: carbamoyltransferase HypF [Deltaproteobacteria bacterium]
MTVQHASIEVKSVSNLSKLHTDPHLASRQAIGILRGKRAILKVTGIVQGVGFRPFIYNLARRYGLKGWVINSSEGVNIEVEGEEVGLRKFITDIQEKPPSLAAVEEINIRDNLVPKGYINFEIRESLVQPGKFVPVSPDISICEDCLCELFDPSDRRYFYPFINCTNCGPRFTIVKGIPYDRDKTTMEKFVMCPSCQKEYENPLNRRFHAQPNACPECGPEVKLIKNSEFRFLNETLAAQFIEPTKGNEAILKTIELLEQGKIIAIKGLGGFHLVCDAFTGQTVYNLRAKKYREDKPFAIMARDIKTIKQFCEISVEEEKLLSSLKRPIVILRKKPETNPKIAEEVAPNNKYLGFMLPYTPLHYLLFSGSLSALIMTSGNISDEPIAYRNEEAINRLKKIADYFLIHNRDIYIRCDDSVARIFNDREMVIRRSRGYVSQPIRIENPKLRINNAILSCGAHLNNTFCLAKDNNIFLSHHIGDLENVETMTVFERGIEHFKNLFDIQPKIVAHDLHPDYLSTIYARNLLTLSPNIRTVAVQHHHAHIGSCLADNQKDSKVIGVAFDGTGYGDDGNIWGGEFLIADFNDYKRIAHLKYVPLPGGEKAIKEPWRTAASFLYQTYGKEFLNLNIDFLHRLDKQKWVVLQKMIDQRINSPLTSSMGRLFDAVSSLIGIRDVINYEGQAAFELEQIAEQLPISESRIEYYEYLIIGNTGSLIIDPLPIFEEIIEDLKEKVSKSVISVKFHNTVAKMIVETCSIISKDPGLNEVALSGGVFQNIFLLKSVCYRLKKEGFIVYTHSKVPPNDGGICLGQAVIANAKINRG